MYKPSILLSEDDHASYSKYVAYVFNSRWDSHVVPYLQANLKPRQHLSDYVSHATKNLTQDPYTYVHLLPDHLMDLGLHPVGLCLPPGYTYLMRILFYPRVEHREEEVQGPHTDINLATFFIAERGDDYAWKPRKDAFWGEWAEYCKMGRAKLHPFRFSSNGYRNSAVLFVHPDSSNKSYARHLEGRRRYNVETIDWCNVSAYSL